MVAMLCSTSVWADDAEEVLLDANFGTSPTGWTSIDKSPRTGVTWTWREDGYSSPTNYAYSDCVRLGSDYSSTHDDWYVSPALELKAGKTYKVKTLVGTSYNEVSQCVTTTLELGTSKSDVSSFSTIATLSTVKAKNANDLDEMGETNEVTVSEDGTYYLAFHGLQENDSQLWGFLLGMRVATDASTEGISNVAAGAGAMSYSHSSSQLSVPEGSTVSIYAANGAQAFSTEASQATIDLSSLADGIYVVKATDATGHTSTLKVVK